MQILSLPLMTKSQKVIFVNSNKREDQICVPKHESKFYDDDEEDVFALSLHDHYAARPTNLSNICLALFAVTYNTIYGKMDTTDDNSKNTEKVITLKNGIGKM